MQLNTPPSQSAPLSQANLSSLYNSSGLGAAAPLTSTGASSLLPPSYTPTPQPTAPSDDISILDTSSGPPSGNFSSLSGVASSTQQQSNNLQDLNMLGDSKLIFVTRDILCLYMLIHFCFIKFVLSFNLQFVFWV